ncbi:MAG: hypothetical protein DRJ03_30135 [Chloroflexi bacterium]|nr:MAG: hypothetical protein DRJ03_30135 [Chloroflexota bacterium]
MSSSNELNNIFWPEDYDSDLNWPAVTQVTEDTGEEINRNRDALLRLERVLGLNPQIGIFTDPVTASTATVAQRISLLEQGLAEGRFDLQTINVGDAFIVGLNPRNVPFIHIGNKEEGPTVATPVVIKGPLLVEDSLLSNANQAVFQVPIWIRLPEASGASSNVIIEGTSNEAQPLVHIKDFLENPLSNTDSLAALVEGNLKVVGGKIIGEFAVEHDTLLGIQTTPTYDHATGTIIKSARHVARGDFHSHRKSGFNDTLGCWIVEPNSSSDTFGVIRHLDLEGITTATNQEEPFFPDPDIPYHVTGGDEHNHEQGRGARIRHEALSGIDPQSSTHVTGGDTHVHSSGDGGAITHGSLLDVGVVTHANLDVLTNTTVPEHIALIDPASAGDTIPANNGLAHHVDQGHVSDPSAHHIKYTDAEAITAAVEVVKATTVYTTGQQVSTLAHIQTLGSGTPSIVNPHGLTPDDIGALAGFDGGGQVPPETEQLLQDMIIDVGLGLLPGPFGSPSENELDPADTYRIAGGSKTLSVTGTTTVVTGLATISTVIVGDKTATAGVTHWIESSPGVLQITHTSTSGTDEIWWQAIGQV